jgi:hypothetical protein
MPCRSSAPSQILAVLEINLLTPSKAVEHVALHRTCQAFHIIALSVPSGWTGLILRDSNCTEMDCSMQPYG